jgi:GDP-4-dehydro-6-deoxy-D-mannose reductase
LPLIESAELRPTSVYGVSKAAADALVFKCCYRDQLHTIRVRPFSHIGPGQAEHFAISSFAKQVALVKLGKQEPVIKVGNLDVKRDYSDVSDIVRGYREALLNGKAGEAYNLCSGISVEVGDLLQRLITLSGVDMEVVQDPARVRTVDIPEIVGSFEKASRDFGWKPRVERDAMLDSLLAYWLDALS